MEQPPPMPESLPETPSAPTMSLGARLLNVFAVPGDVFAELKRAPVVVSNWLVPALLLIAVGWVGAWLVWSQPQIKQQVTEMVDKQIQKQIEKSHASAEQAEQIRKFGDIGLRVNMVLGPVVMAFWIPFFWGLILWLAGGKAMKGNFSYMKAVEASGLASTIMVLEAIVKTLLIVLSGNLFASPSLAMLIKDFDPQNTTHSLLALVNVMTLWVLGVRSIALARLSSVSFARAAVWVFGIWAAYTGLFTGLGLAFKAAFKQ